jgi:hypothetical protein
MEWLAVIIGTVAVLVVTFLRGASSGRDEQEQQHTKEVLRNVEKAKQIDVPTDANDVRQRLRDNLRK